MKILTVDQAEKLEGNRYALHRMINPLTLGSKNIMSFFVRLDAGGEIPEHRHGPAEVGLHFLRGNVSVTVDGENRNVEPSTAVYVPVGSTIGLRNTGEKSVEFIAILSPPIDVSVCPVCGIEVSATIGPSELR